MKGGAAKQRTRGAPKDPGRAPGPLFRVALRACRAHATWRVDRVGGEPEQDAHDHGRGQTPGAAGADDERLEEGQVDRKGHAEGDHGKAGEARLARAEPRGAQDADVTEPRMPM